LKKAAAQSPEAASSGTISPANTMPFIIDAVRAYATVGEICEALRDVMGTYTRRVSHNRGLIRRVEPLFTMDPGVRHSMTVPREQTTQFLTRQRFACYHSNCPRNQPSV
jgi:hypothetical protein